MALNKTGKFDFIDLRIFFPGNIAAFFLVSRNSRYSREDIAGFLEEMGCPASVVHKPKQVHGDAVIENCRDNECDGVYTREKGEAITIAVADCVPILISVDNGRAIIALHSGWKGTIGRIAEKACSMFDPGSFDRVWIGPSIRRCCYKVDGERIKAFRVAFPESLAIDESSSSLDLPVINTEMFQKMGVPQEKVTVDGRCTACHPDNLASYRRDGENAGGMVAVAVKR